MTNRTLPRRRAIVLAAGAAVVAGLPAYHRHSNAQGLTKVSLQTGWLAQAEHGGSYQALANGFYKDNGLDVEIRPGGPQVNVVQLFMSGSSDFAEADSFRAFAFVQEKLPAVVVATFFQKDPRVLLSHPGVGNDTLASLKGKPLMVATGGRQTYWLWLKSRFGFTDDQLRPYAFSLTPWLVDKQASVQGFLTSEPLNARKAGVEPVVHLLADQGFDNYQNALITSPKTVKERPEVVQRFVDATAKGWASYLNGDPSPGNALIKKANPQMQDDVLAYAISVMNRYGIIETPETKAQGIGTMNEVRWKRFYDAMSAAGALPSNLDVKSAYTTQFVSGKRS